MYTFNLELTVTGPYTLVPVEFSPGFPFTLEVGCKDATATNSFTTAMKTTTTINYSQGVDAYSFDASLFALSNIPASSACLITSFDIVSVNPAGIVTGGTNQGSDCSGTCWVTFANTPTGTQNLYGTITFDIIPRIDANFRLDADKVTVIVTVACDPLTPIIPSAILPSPQYLKLKSNDVLSWAPFTCLYPVCCDDSDPKGKLDYQVMKNNIGTAAVDNHVSSGSFSSIDTTTNPYKT